MRFRLSSFVFLLLAMIAATGGTASAAPIQYVVQGTGSGFFQSAPVTNLSFTVTILADTDGVGEYSPGLFAVNNQSVTLQVGPNTYSSFYIGSSWKYPDGGFAHEPNPIGGESDTPLFAVKFPGLSSYPLNAPIGPVSFDSPISTIFNLVFSPAGLALSSLSEATFEATLVPEPSTLLLAAACAAPLLARRRVKR